ncbi:hypothetical protein O1R50_00155 [Glycomyces luteolus]|uniref:Uncharacterized protein n=1 Tax=Glycomyces luteolus TaxID=2670330 RepID=A0A9X3T1U6_9ACTN|nr:hypothetical protein [Glycomyces luteolus]MDA1358015.1 hypothetical protein [Glycomyces luteolus]
MSKGFRVLLQIFQVLFLLGALLFMAFSFLMAYMDFGATEAEERFVDTWILGFALLSIAVSPALWALSRRGQAAAPPSSTGTYDRVQPSPAVPSQPQQQPGGVFEPMQSSQAPAPPASSYGQPSAGGITPSSSPQAGSPWGSGR